MLFIKFYYDADTGFGSIAQTFKDAKQVLNSITYNDVKEFLERQNHDKQNHTEVLTHTLHMNHFKKYK